MQVPPQITFRNIEATEDLEAVVREKIAKLEEFFDRITSCHVIVESPHRSHQRGSRYRVRVHVVVPRTELVVDRQPSEHREAEDLRGAVREAFDSMRRQLEDDARELRGDVKSHPAPQ